MRKSKMKEKILYLNDEEMRSFISDLKKERDRLIIKLLYELGCTLKELLHIRVRDINLDLNKITILHTSGTQRDERDCVISEQTKQMIIENLERMGLSGKKLAYVLSSSHGGAMTERRVNQIITKLLQDNGFEDRCNPQCIKYSHIINAYRRHIPVSVIQRQVGISQQRIHAILSSVESEEEFSYTDFFV
jgi:site-specific recombinase XerD